MPTAFNLEPELLLRRNIGPDASPSLDAEDYEIVHDGKAVGRLSRSDSDGRVSWQWSIYGAIAGQHSNGIADSPSDAKACFLALRVF
jgi:hypothetical protein